MPAEMLPRADGDLIPVHRPNSIALRIDACQQRELERSKPGNMKCTVMPDIGCRGRIDWRLRLRRQTLERQDQSFEKGMIHGVAPIASHRLAQ